MTCRQITVGVLAYNRSDSFEEAIKQICESNHTFREFLSADRFCDTRALADLQ